MYFSEAGARGGIKTTSIITKNKKAHERTGKNC